MRAWTISGIGLLCVIGCGGHTSTTGQVDQNAGIGGGEATGGSDDGGSSSEATAGSDSGGSSGDTGGTSSGGASIGGTSSGGAATGGTSSGGAATGGTSSGGAGTGGASSGGAATGGAGTGGAGTGGAGTGGTSSGGSSTGGGSTVPAAGYVDPVPAEGSSWDYLSGDPLNSTPPLLARFGDGVVIAGATQDPELAGLEAFDPDIESEAFVARLDHGGQLLWSQPLSAAGLPWGLRVDAEDNTVVVAPYLPNTTRIMPSTYADSMYLAKLDATGEFVFEEELPFEDGRLGYALAVSDDGSIYIAGMRYDDSFNPYVMIAKYDGMGNEQWVDLHPHEGSTAYARGADVAPNGDLVITGSFNGTFDLGGGPLTTTAYLDGYGMPVGFVARFTPEGEHVWSYNFGGPVFDLGMHVLALSDGDLLLGGKLSSEATVGGISVSADVDEGQGFIARLDGGGDARWVTLTPALGSTQFLATDPDETLFHAVGQYGGPDYVGADFLFEYDALGNQILRASVLSGAVRTTSVAVDGLSSLWVSGAFTDSVDFGNDNLLSSSEAGVFLVRLDREP